LCPHHAQSPFVGAVPEFRIRLQPEHRICAPGRPCDGDSEANTYRHAVTSPICGRRYVRPTTLLLHNIRKFSKEQSCSTASQACTAFPLVSCSLQSRPAILPKRAQDSCCTALLCAGCPRSSYSKLVVRLPRSSQYMKTKGAVGALLQSDLAAIAIVTIP
jgi:hypothetical protein